MRKTNTSVCDPEHRHRHRRRRHRHRHQNHQNHLHHHHHHHHHHQHQHQLQLMTTSLQQLKHKNNIIEQHQWSQLSFSRLFVHIALTQIPTLSHPPRHHFPYFKWAFPSSRHVPAQQHFVPPLQPRPRLPGDTPRVGTVGSPEVMMGTPRSVHLLLLEGP